jgi:hypothetical protein
MGETATSLEEQEIEVARRWLQDNNLYYPEEALPPDKILRRYKALSKCQFGEGVTRAARESFLQRLIASESNLAAY